MNKERYHSNLEAIFRSVKDAIITVDKELSVIEINEAAKNICGFSRNAIGKVFSSLKKRCEGECIESLMETINKKQSVEIYRIECGREHRPGQVVTITTYPLLNRQGTFSGAIMVVRDETRLSDLKRDLEERQQFHNIIGKSKKCRRFIPF